MDKSKEYRPDLQALGPMAFTSWPASKPLPTRTEIELAKARHLEEIRENLDDDSDFCDPLGFVMATYSRRCWWHFFFPDERMEWPTPWNATRKGARE